MVFITLLSVNYVFISRSASKFTVHKATNPHQIKFAIDWCTHQENWPGGEYDYEVYFAMAPDGCYYGVLGDEKVCYIQTVTYGDNKEYCYLGGFIVKKELRCHGYGKEIGFHALSELPKTCLSSMSAVLDMEAEYKKYGFLTLWNEYSYSFDAQKIVYLSKLSDYGNINIADNKEVSFSKLVKYDTDVFCYSREFI